MQYAKYGIIGVLATAVNTIATIFFVQVVGLSPTGAVIAAFPIAFAVSYALNQRWTFASSASHLAQVPRYLVGQLLGLALNAALMFVINEQLGLHYWLGLACSVAFVPPVVFAFQKYWTFRTSRLHPGQAET